MRKLPENMEQLLSWTTPGPHRFISSLLNTESIFPFRRLQNTLSDIRMFCSDLLPLPGRIGKFCVTVHGTSDNVSLLMIFTWLSAACGLWLCACVNIKKVALKLQNGSVIVKKYGRFCIRLFRMLRDMKYGNAIFWEPADYLVWS